VDGRHAAGLVEPAIELHRDRGADHHGNHRAAERRLAGHAQDADDRDDAHEQRHQGEGAAGHRQPDAGHHADDAEAVAGSRDHQREHCCERRIQGEAPQSPRPHGAAAEFVSHRLPPLRIPPPARDAL